MATFENFSKSTRPRAHGGTKIQITAYPLMSTRLAWVCDDNLSLERVFRHKMSLKEFNTQYMINGDSNDDNEEKTSRSKTSVPLATTDARVDSELAAREPEAKKVEKEKLVECDKQW